MVCEDGWPTGQPCHIHSLCVALFPKRPTAGLLFPERAAIGELTTLPQFRQARARPRTRAAAVFYNFTTLLPLSSSSSSSATSTFGLDRAPRLLRQPHNIRVTMAPDKDDQLLGSIRKKLNRSAKNEEAQAKKRAEKLAKKVAPGRLSRSTSPMHVC